MSADITPADLAKFIHPVPVGAVIPAGTPYAYRAGAQIGIRSQGMPYESTQVDASVARWTAEPIRTPEQQRLEDEYAAACEAIYAAERAAAKAREEAEALRPRAESLYRELQKAGRR